MNNFSVVMAVHDGDSPDDFIIAVRSVFDQTLEPDEVVVVVDGPLSQKFDSALASICNYRNLRFEFLAGKSGPGVARHAGILTVKSEFVAIMDADDISTNNRFMEQVTCFENPNIDCVGGVIEEFQDTPGDLKRLRRVPLHHQKILNAGRWRYPLNHVTIMMRLRAYLKAGGYSPMKSLEDYDLFHRLLISGARFLNIESTIVLVRTGDKLIQRRRGLSYLIEEFLLLNRMRKSNYLRSYHWFLCAFFRAILRILPGFLVAFIYRFLRAPCN